MNKQKLLDYNLTGSIHTLQLKTQGDVGSVQDQVVPCITVNTQHINDDIVSSCLINPNKLTGDLYTYSDFETAFQTILVGAGIVDYRLVRVDLRLDNFDQDHYRRFAKLNKYLISAMAIAYPTRNCYRTVNLFSQEQLSIAIKNRYFELENYDKVAESNGLDTAKSRLEERSKSWAESDKDIPNEFCQHWSRRWQKALTCLDKVQMRFNDELERLYLTGRHTYPCRFRSLTDFLIEFQDCIFTSSQLIDLLQRLPEIGSKEKAINRARNHKKRYGIEYFSKRDVKAAIAEIQRATKSFFNS